MDQPYESAWDAPGNDLSRYVLAAVRKDDEFVLYRGKGDPGWAAILVMEPVSEYPAPATIRRLEHAYSLRNELHADWASRPIALTQHKGRPQLVLEDPGGEPLDTLLGSPMELTRFLHFAVSLSSTLGRLHARGVIHKDVNPTNVLFNAATGQVWLTGFGIATQLRRERQSPEPPEFIAGTLAYMAPEQTGRMNRSVDSRCDLYALGVTLYELLTGHLPFTASEPMEWVHCHVARSPLPPAELRKDVPTIVSAIVVKLLAKTAEERYQTAAGVESDLRLCRAAWDADRQVDDFPLGTHDIPDRLLIPEKLYGREREIEILLASFDRIVKASAPELVLVSGYSGIGKSSVVNELHRVLVPPRGIFASGKFDQYKRDIPYSTLAQAFQTLIRALLFKSDAELARWREMLLEALDPNAQLIVDLVPELNLIIGDQPPVPELEPQQAQNRFQLVFRRFISVFARPEHPLALFLDDLQWIDSATLDLLEDLLTRSELRHLILVGAYRDNEVTPTHPLMRKLEAIRTAGGKVTEIKLAPLARRHLGQLIVDALRCERDRAEPLAQLIHEKTGGNPFFAIQFMSALVEEGMLTFDHGAARWTWEIDRIRAKGYTDNIVDLMVAKVTRLPAETQNALRQLACLGNVAAIRTISIVLAISEEQIHTTLWPAVDQELVERLRSAYRFVHDRIQEAAYTMLPEELRGEAHLRIGRLLAAAIPPENREEAIFDIVNQLNRGAALIDSQGERDQLAEFNLIAGGRAKASTAYASALKYLVIGAGLLAEDCWARQGKLAFALELLRAECEFLTGELTQASDRLTALSARVAQIVDLATVASLHMEVCTTLDQTDRSIALCLEYLRRRGVQWSPHPTEEEARREYERIWVQLGDRAIEDLIDLPMMTDPIALATMDVLTKAVVPAIFTDRNLFALVACRAVNLCLEYGNSDGSCFLYETFGMIAGASFHNYDAGFGFGKLGYDLVEKVGWHRFQARTYMTFAGLIMPWTKHVQTGRDLVRRAFDAANKIGDLTFAAYCCNQLNTKLLAAGEPLAEVEGEAQNGLEFAQKARFGLVINIITAQLGLIGTLRGLKPKFGSFDDERFSEVSFERHLSADPALALPECWYWIRKLQGRFFAGDYPVAVYAASRAQRLLWTSPSFFEMAEYHFYSALAQAASCESNFADQSPEHFEALTAHHRQLEVWAKNCPENFEDRAALVGGEIARIEGREIGAMRLYERAIRSAHDNGFVHHEAIAYERASAFYRARGFDEFADFYLRSARYGYLRWGAAGKVRQLDEMYPHLRKEEPRLVPTSTIAAPVEHLDLTTVIKVSQAVSGEIVLEKLIDTLLRTAVEQAGAGRGLLIHTRGTKLRIEAEANTDGNSVTIGLRDASISGDELPESVVQYSARTQQSVILDDASARGSFSNDEYIRRNHCRSILCLPLVKQGNLIGVLYLENNLADRVFTPARIAVLNVLASAAAISLENSLLYRDLQEREAKIRRLVDANIVGVMISRFDGQILEANDAFLEMVGSNRDDLNAGRLWSTELTPAEWQRVNEREWAQTRSIGSFGPFEKEYLRKDGSRVPVLIGGTAIGETRTETVSFVLDLTERKRAEEAVRQSEKQLRDVIDTIPTVVWTALPDGSIDFANRHWEEYSDLSSELTAGSGWETTVHPEDLKRNAEKWRASTTTGEPFENEVRFRRADGEYRWFLVRAVPMRDARSRIVKWYGTTTDIEDRKRAEQLQADLAHINRVTTLGELTASLAHEIKQPLAATVTNASACLRWLNREQPELERARTAAGRIVADGKRAGDIIERLRSMYKKSLPQRELLDVNETVREMVVLLRGEANRYAVSIRTDLAPHLPKSMADRVQLQQVLMNLMLNGIEAMKETGGALTVKSQLTEHDRLTISVSDTGVGLPADRVDEIFNAFFTTKPQGSGMGLAISRSIVESHGGRLWATANDGRGASFHFTLPTAAGAAEVPADKT